MGTALTEAILNAGYTTTIWNRTAEKAEKFLVKGAKLGASAIDTVQASPLVVACVLNYEALFNIIKQIGSAMTDKVWVNLNTGTPEDARKAASIITEFGAKYIDGAIMDIPQSIGKPETLIFYSGNEKAFKLYQSTLMTLGGRSIFLGSDAGLSKLYELGVGSTLVPTLLGFLQGAALVGTANIKAEKLAPYTTEWLNMAISLLPKIAKEIDTKSYKTDIASLNVFTGISHDIKAYEEAGIKSDVLHPMKALIDRGVSLGYGSDSISRLIELIKNP